VAQVDATDALLGRVIADAYVIQELVGIGGMGRVYRAEQRALGRMVAVKVVHKHLLGDKDSVSRFYTEARAASSLNHPNSVSIFDFGRTDDGMLYLVMEYLRGRDLARVIHDESSISLLRIVEIGIGVLGALGEAHARGVVHRDLKPENIILERLRGGTDLVKVVDFGLAKIRGVEPAEAARGLVAGTPDYMSPEQARALEVDGRGDLYALGVVLFELLTGRLPFIDDTPSKVMMRHVVDPVPDPRDIAPYRGFPDALVEIVLRALAKDPGERFKDADEMTQALQKVVNKLAVSADRARCPSCGALNEPQRAFCGDCGRRLVQSSPGVGVRSLPPPGERPLLGRSEVFARLIEALHMTEKGSESAHIMYLVGELGIGKTRLLAELGAHATREGCLVVESAPHESGAKVAYAGIRPVIARLLNVPEARLAALALDDGLFRDPVARAGMAELVEPEGLLGYEGVSRVGAVAAALARAVELAASRASNGRVVLLFDDLPRCDGLSSDVLAAFAEQARDQAVFVLVSSQAPIPLCLRWPGPTVELPGIAPSLAKEFVRGELVLSELANGGLLPLHLEQLRALRWEPTPDEREPPSLADAVVRRLSMLDVGARRVVQALAVLGERVSLMSLRHVVETEDLPSLAQLVEHGLLKPSEGLYSFVHPYLRDVVEASTPAETRKVLHAKVLDLASNVGQPLEVRAEHAFRSGDVMVALMLLERMGQEALRRGDPSVGMLAFRNGLELARRTVLETGDEALDPALVSFSRQLAETLVASGDVTGAAGVLNEAFQLAGPSSVERARMTLVLGRVAERRDRPREAVRQLGLATELAQQLHNKGLEARAQWALSRVRRSEGDTLGAVNALSAAAERLMAIEPRSAPRCLAELELGELLVDMGDMEGAADHLERAHDLAQDGDFKALAASALGVLGAVDELSGRRDAAKRRYLEASLLAANAGDARGRVRWQRAHMALSSPS
jgi:tRNA A-37 threonylcarbamoyl transferase component Bud32/tetratricopeptide (TPR) repeat protein